jgi:hypothetical protein
VPSIRQILVAVLILASAGKAGAANSEEAVGQLRLAATSRIYVTLVPRAAEEDDGPRWLEGAPTVRPALNLPLRSIRRNRLTFSMTHRDVLVEGDQLQLRLASDAHIVAQLLSGGAFSEADDSWIAVLGLASRFRLSYTSGPFELSVSARRKFGDGSVRARLSYNLRF